jgi:hypothetical protein
MESRESRRSVGTQEKYHIKPLTPDALRILGVLVLCSFTYLTALHIKNSPA